MIIHINKIWKSKQKQLPCTNCIIFADESVIILDFKFFQSFDNQKYTAEVNPLCDTKLYSMLKYDSDCLVQVDEWKNAFIYNENKKYISGGGAYGSDGFVACEDLQGNLIWAMFFDKTNPIKKLTIKDNWLIGLTEHSESQIEINLDNLTEIRYIIF